MQHLYYMIAGGCPKELLLHTELFRGSQYKKIFDTLSIDYTMENFARLYEGTLLFLEVDRIPTFDTIKPTLEYLKKIREYQLYKEERNLVDFDDLLILTYFHALHHQDRLKKYSWIQIGEVQDLSPFQFAIIDLFTDFTRENVTLHLGDEKQAIFSFIGAVCP